MARRKRVFMACPHCRKRVELEASGRVASHTRAGMGARYGDWCTGGGTLVQPPGAPTPPDPWGAR